MAKKTIEEKELENLSEADYEAQSTFRYALRQFLRFSENTTRAVGMTPQKYQALLAIRAVASERDGITIGELAERLQVRPHSAVGMADRLSERGLVVRQTGEKDRRQVYVRLTEQGEEVLAQLVLAHREELENLWPQLKKPVKRLTRPNGKG